MDGLETLEKIRALDDPPEVIMISGHGTIETAVRATKLGAYDFVEKPLSLEKTLILVKNAIEARRLRHDNRDLRKQLQAKSVIVGDSVPMKALAPADWPDGAHQWTRADLRRVGHRQGIGRACHPHAEPAQRRDVRGGQLRRDSGRPDRKRTVRTSQSRRSRARPPTRKASFKRPIAERCFWMKSAT